MLWLMHRASPLWVGVLVLLAAGVWRTAVGLEHHAVGLTLVGLAMLAVAGVFIRRALRPAVQDSE